MMACKLTTRAPNSHGYGQVKFKGRQIGAHVKAWEDKYGPVPKGQCVLHKCDVRLCIEPTHLFLGTRGDNNRDRAAKGRNGIGKGKLTKAQVRKTHKLFSRQRNYGEVSALAKEFGVERETLYHVKGNPKWKGC